MCGIFGFVNYGGLQVTRGDVIKKLLQGLRRLEYRGYDSAGFVVDGPGNKPLLIRVMGGVDKLVDAVDYGEIGAHDLLRNHVGIAHTRWATHGEPAPRNAHPQPSDPTVEFAVVHNGIITNYRSLRDTLQKHGHKFASETDTEVIAALLKFVYDNTPRGQFTFCDLVAHVVARLEGAYALLVRSSHYPGELVATKKGSPLVVGVVKQPAAADTAAEGMSVPIDYVTLEDATLGSSTISSGAGSDDDSDNFLSVRKMSGVRARGLDQRTAGSSAVKGPEHDRYSPIKQLREGNEGAAGGHDSDPLPRPVPTGLSAAYAVSSDPAALLDLTKRVVYLREGDVAHLTPSGLKLYRGQELAATDDAAERTIETLTMELDQISRGGYDHFMLKEICEQPESLRNTMRGRVRFDLGKVHLGGLAPHIASMRRSHRLLMVACGTSYNSCVATRQLFEQMTELPVDVQLASDLLDRQTPVFRGDTCFFVSQSGETADTLRALEFCRGQGALTVGVVNVVGSSIARLTHCGVYCNAGPEIGVASTKAYTSQITVLTLIAMYLGQDRVSQVDQIRSMCDALRRLPEQVATILERLPELRQACGFLATANNLLIVGRGYQYATCREGALKIKEIAYIHTEAISAGELKHGPLALITEDQPIIVILTKDSLYDRALNALHQITARRGRPLVLLSEGDPMANTLREQKLTVIEVPVTHEALQSMLNVIPFQLFSYYVALGRGYNVDRPRNLAKSVTVE